MNIQISYKQDKNIQEYFFINSAYLSELWAFENLKQMYVNKKFVDEETYQQMIDEERHARMLRNILIQHNFNPIDELKFAMQEVLYKKVCHVDYSIYEHEKSEFSGMHTIMEKRAIWNYKTFLLGSKNDELKKVVRLIIKDEKQHIRKVPKSKNLMELEKQDRWLYRNYLYLKYNKMNLLQCLEFWEKYFSKEDNVHC
jgi:hypothetical protein